MKGEMVMKKRKMMALLMAAVMTVSGLAGCGGYSDSGTEASAEKEAGTRAEGGEKAPESEAAGAEIDVKSLPAGSVNLSLMLPLGQWTDNFNTLIDAYKAEHPEIGEITATFPSSDKYDDLLVSALSAGDLPNIINLGYGIRRQDWWQYCEDLSTGCPAYGMLTEEQIANGTNGEYGMQVMPMVLEGTGILYNTRILEEAGWDHTPQTRDELLQYCKDLKAQGIQPFMLPWAETYLNLFNNVGNYWLLNKPDGGKATLEKLMAGEDVDLASDPEMTELLDTYEEILIPFAQEGAVSADKWTCRNAFFAEECAMLVGEGSYETPNIQNANPAMLEYVKQDILPVSNDAEKNKMAIASISASVTKNDDPNKVACAKDFVSFLVSSEEARIWHQETMGSPTAIQSLEVSENLPVIAKDVIDSNKAGKGVENIFVYMPSSIYTDMQENWAKYVAGAAAREEFLERYQQIFKDYSDGIYG